MNRLPFFTTVSIVFCLLIIGGLIWGYCQGGSLDGRPM